MTITVHPQYCLLPGQVHGDKLRILEIDADSVTEAESALALATGKGWRNYMGGIATNKLTGGPCLVLYKMQPS